MKDQEDSSAPSSLSSYKSKGGLRRILAALRYAGRGLLAGWRHEAAFRQEVVVGGLFSLLSLWLAPSLTFAVLMNVSVVLVWCMEMVNSAIEAVADAVSLEQHPLLGRAKDMGSAAVLLSICIAGGIWTTALYVKFTG